MKKIIVLGAGMVGSAMAIDLVKKHKVLLTDINMNVLNDVKSKCIDLEIKTLDVTDKDKLKNEIINHDLVLSAVPGFLGYKTLETIIDSKIDVVDISFFPENSLDLDKKAKSNNVTAIVDCGVAPGMDNIILGYYNEKYKITDFDCIVGGLPKVKKWPFCYKAPFSPMDVIEEYTRPARYVENGKIITREALTDSEFVEFDKIGTLESFNSDGLRSIIYTMSHIPNMKEKTLRYPGHIEYIKVLKASGFFDDESIEINGTNVSKLDFTSKILFKQWELEQNEEEFTVMRVSLKGLDKDGEEVSIEYNLYDEYCKETNTSSMARTTGYTATAAVNLVLDNLFAQKGVFPPELVGKYESCFNYFIEYLKDRNIIYNCKLSNLVNPIDHKQSNNQSFHLV